MSVSDKERREYKQRTLVKMFRVVGDRRVWQVLFDSEDAELPGVLQTTWRELIDDGLVDDKMSAMGSPRYRLTYRGWLRALIWSGDVDSKETRDRCSRLAQALKRIVKGRKSHYDEFTDVDAVVADTNLPDGWVVNAIHSKLLGVVFPDDKWDAYMDRGDAIRVSPTFGLNHLFDNE